MGDFQDHQEPIKVGFVNGDPLYLQGVGELLKSQPGFEVLTGSPASMKMSSMSPPPSLDVAIMIVEARGRFVEESISSVVEELPESRILVLTEHEDLGLLWRMFLIGVHACLAKSVQLDELVSTIRGIHRDPGRFVLSVGRTALWRLQPAAEMNTILTSRETEILKLVANGSTNSEIAQALFIAEATVKRHLSNTYAKLGVSSRFAVIRRAAELGILPQDLERSEGAIGGDALARGSAPRWKNGVREPTL